ncbi:hypothetical protein sscle_16g110010 [Sclerotinia sclerotiorum 1980 UF-70]|uniref:Uncharacterized protein n=1 Tax=Sclerotinia sclerotiorum (strain ATCC 18683 / 1980 / Ss-1) TaxID=665079 RepID=A0A1D9QMS8_SCLS1|nr:hypothetical protein sscle_16g110010 [Sclerotinia sclerotiorum 1980 UF-70]
MANTSNLDIISSNPVKDRLCAFRQLFESTRVDLGVVESSNTMQAVLSAATGYRNGPTRKKAKFKDRLFRRWTLFDFASSAFLT